MMFAHIKRSLRDFGVEFDVYFHENSLFESGAVDKAVATLKDNGNLYESDGAWWLRSTDFGDDKDRVVIKSDGDAAYIAGDIAYVADKFDRGHTLAIYMLGADHHGYIARLRAAAQALGYDADAVEVLIGQMVNLVRNDKPVKMSKRAGTIITLEDLVDAIGVDGARYSLARSSVDQTLDIDLDLWTRQSSDNPVYYVQYGHARLCSIARRASEAGVSVADPDLGLLTHEKEGDLIRTLGEYPAVVQAAAELREPHRGPATSRNWRARSTSSMTPARSCPRPARTPSRSTKRASHWPWPHARSWPTPLTCSASAHRSGCKWISTTFLPTCGRALWRGRKTALSPSPGCRFPRSPRSTERP